MNTFSRATLALTVTAAVALTGCASIDTTTTKVGSVFGSSNSTTSSAIGGGAIGCAGGALVSRFILGKSALIGCAAGGAIGAVTSVAIHKHLLAEAQKTKADVEKTNGVVATVTTKEVAAKNDTTGKPEPTEALDRLTIDLPLSKVKVHAADIGRVIDKATALADQATEPTTVTVRGPAAQRAWIDARVHADLKDGSSVKVVDDAADDTSIVISPVPVTK